MENVGPKALIASGVLIVAVGGYFALRPSAEQRLRRQIDDLGEALRVTEAETNVVVRMARINDAFSRIFAKDVRVKVPDIGPIGATRKDVAAAAAQAGMVFRTAEVTFGAPSIAFDPGKLGADAHASGTLTAVEHGGSPRQETRKVTFRFEKIEGEWRIASLDVAPKDD